MARSLSFTLSSALLLVGLAAPVHAQEAGTTEDDEARSLFEAGRTAYQGARYESALRYFEDAYELSNRSALLFNIGSTLERLQRNEEALARFRAYLAAMPNAPNRDVVQRRISFLEGILSGQTPQPEPEDTSATGTSVDIGTATPSDSDSGGGGSVIDEWWFWTIIAVAIAGAGAGITAGIVVGTSGVEAPLPGDFSTVFALQGEF